MATKKPKRQSKEGVGVSLEGLIGSFAKGVAGILRFAGKLEEEGKDEYIEQDEIEGKTKSGKEYRGAYGFRVKVGLNPEDFSARGGSAFGGKGQKKLSNR